MIGGSPIFNYLSDDPQSYLLLLKDYIRPSTDICKGCKTRCCESYIKTASSPGLAWGRLAPDGRPRPEHTRLDSQLSALGITASNAYGLELPEAEIDKVFQPAVRRLTIDRAWEEVYSCAVAMTAYRGPARPDRYDAERNQHGVDPFCLGKKMKVMCWPRFTGVDMVKARGGMIEWFVRGLGQCLSDGAGGYLATAAAVGNSSDQGEKIEKEQEGCTCPLFSCLQGRHPDTFTGFEWIDLVLSVARERIDPALLSAWCAAPLFEEELGLASPSRPLIPGYDSRKDTTWHQTPHGYSRIRKNIESRNAVYTPDIINSDPRHIELSFLFGFDVPTGCHPLNIIIASPPSSSPPSSSPEFQNFSFKSCRENQVLQLLEMFQNSDSTPPWFHLPHQTLETFDRGKFAHHMRGSMLATFMALNAGMKLNRPMGRFGRVGEGVDWVTASCFSFLPDPHPNDPERHPMKKVFEDAVKELRKETREVWEVPVDYNKREGVKKWREGMPNLGTRQWSWAGTFEELRDEEGNVVPVNELVPRNGEWDGADEEDWRLHWGPEEFMRGGFTFEME
ncbi:hypothetical protein B0T20DRAFT_494009 [Sordaria brevicollis]|uniref:Uncharacterized protein n=1 Tax=Sordaria brevicollis TaxID=83679 RepID=A0AAE0NR74_SORBR|nr:hypothetical protein B0T20DRAFT_494009 [Sordaria brevicollis]